MKTSKTSALAVLATLTLPALLTAAVLAQVGDAVPSSPEEIEILTIGDPAPAFEISDWIKGERIDGFEPGTITVMEFWATWCGPCRTAFPHISELQERYRDYGVRVIGVSDETVEKVRNFLATDEWDSKMRYTVVTDPDKSTYVAYMEAAGQIGIPTSFIVGRTGKVEWVGHPMNMDEPLERIVQGTWDAQAFKPSFEVSAAANRERIRTTSALRAAQQKEDWDAVIAIYDDLLEKDPRDFNIAIQRIRVLLSAAKRPDEGYASARALAAAHPADPVLLNAISWTIVDAPGIEPRDLDFALDLAGRANTAAGGRDGGVLDTLARCHWEKGDKGKAIEFQRLAVEHAPPGPMAEDLRKTLEKYEKAQ